MINLSPFNKDVALAKSLRTLDWATISKINFTVNKRQINPWGASKRNVPQFATYYGKYFIKSYNSYSFSVFPFFYFSQI